jgi:hypothetical protein
MDFEDKVVYIIPEKVDYKKIIVETDNNKIAIILDRTIQDNNEAVLSVVKREFHKKIKSEEDEGAGGGGRCGRVHNESNHR